LARTPRKWQGARNPSGLKRVRQAERRHAILQPRRSAAKTLVAKAVTVAHATPDSADVAVSLTEAIAALDRAAKVGAIHPNAAARRKSRLTRKVNAAIGGTTVHAGAHVTKSTGKAAAAKAAKARIAAGKAVKAKGAQTAAGKARAALSKTTRTETAPAAAVAETPAETPAAKPAAKATAAKATTSKAAPKTTAAKSTTTKAAATKSTTKATATKATTAKASTTKTTTAKAAPKTTKAK
jgi:trimeric autotransporter adhesin